MDIVMAPPASSVGPEPIDGGRLSKMEMNRRGSRVWLRRSAFLAGWCALVVAAACGSDEGTAQSAGDPAELLDPCALVTGADAEQALGAPISESDRPEEANSQYLGTCRYVAPRGQGMAVMTVMVHSKEYGQASFRTAKEQPFESQDVSGVGDGAFWTEDLRTLHVLQGEVFFTIGGDLDLEQAKSLALKALERI